MNDGAFPKAAHDVARSATSVLDFPQSPNHGMGQEAEPRFAADHITHSLYSHVRGSYETQKSLSPKSRRWLENAVEHSRLDAAPVPVSKVAHDALRNIVIRSLATKESVPARRSAATALDRASLYPALPQYIGTERSIGFRVDGLLAQAKPATGADLLEWAENALTSVQQLVILSAGVRSPLPRAAELEALRVDARQTLSRIVHARAEELLGTCEPGGFRRDFEYHGAMLERLRALLAGGGLDARTTGRVQERVNALRAKYTALSAQARKYTSAESAVLSEAPPQNLAKRMSWYAKTDATIGNIIDERRAADLPTRAVSARAAKVRADAVADARELALRNPVTLDEVGEFGFPPRDPRDRALTINVHAAAYRKLAPAEASGPDYNDLSPAGIAATRRLIDARRAMRAEYPTSVLSQQLRYCFGRLPSANNTQLWCIDHGAISDRVAKWPGLHLRSDDPLDADGRLVFAESAAYDRDRAVPLDANEMLIWDALWLNGQLPRERLPQGAAVITDE